MTGADVPYCCVFSDAVTGTLSVDATTLVYFPYRIKIKLHVHYI